MMNVCSAPQLMTPTFKSLREGIMVGLKKLGTPSTPNYPNLLLPQPYTSLRSKHINYCITINIEGMLLSSSTRNNPTSLMSNYITLLSTCCWFIGLDLSLVAETPTIQVWWWYLHATLYVLSFHIIQLHSGLCWRIFRMNVFSLWVTSRTHYKSGVDVEAHFGSLLGVLASYEIHLNRLVSFLNLNFCLYVYFELYFNNSYVLFL